MTFNEDIIERATSNTHFREVLSTGPHSQVVVMRIPGGGEIGAPAEHAPGTVHHTRADAEAAEAASQA